MILGITGTLGAGKGTVVDYLKTKGFKHFAVSDTFLKGEAVRRGLAPDRPNRQNIANEYRAQGPTKLMEMVFQSAKSSLEEGNTVIVEPQHTIAEVQFIKNQGGIVIGVDADLPIRYERIHARGGAKDNVSFEQFKEIQDHEMASDDPNKNNLGAALAAADYHIKNNGTLEELHQQIDGVLKKITV